MLSSSRRIHHSDQFAVVLRRGRRASVGSLTVHELIEPNDDAVRCGFVVSKAVGGSVVRHRVTRRLRHLCATRVDSLPAGALLVVRAKPAAATASFAALQQDFSAALDRLHK